MAQRHDVRGVTDKAPAPHPLMIKNKTKRDADAAFKNALTRPVHVRQPSCLARGTGTLRARAGIGNAGVS